MQNTAYLLSVLKWERKSIRWRDFLREGGGEAELNLDWWHNQKCQLCAQVQSFDKMFLFPKIYLPNLLRSLMAPSTYSQLLGDRKQWRTLLITDGRHKFQSRSSKFYKKDQEISMRLEVNLLPCSAPTGTTRCGTSPTCWSTLTGRFSGFRRRFIRFCSSI